MSDPYQSPASTRNVKQPSTRSGAAPEVVSPRSSRRRRRSSSSSTRSRSRSSSPSRSRSRSRSASRSRRRRSDKESSSRPRATPTAKRQPGGGSSGQNLVTLLDTRRRAYDTEQFKVLRCYDEHDRAPEDRLRVDTQNAPEFEGDGEHPVVRGTLSIDGVNYSTYEAHKKEKPHYAERFLDALRDDMISEVGNGIRRDDIALRVYPGAVKTVVLQYDEGTPRRIAAGTWKPADPKLMNAEWCFTVDYALRARSGARQQRMATAMYNALSSAHGLSTYKTAQAYVKWLDPTYGDPQRVSIQRPVLDPDMVSSSHPFAVSREPPATRVVSPHRSVPVDGMYPTPAKHSNPAMHLVGQGRSLQEQQAQGIMEARRGVDAGDEAGFALHHHPPGTPDVQRVRARHAESQDVLSPHSRTPHSASPYGGGGGGDGHSTGAASAGYSRMTMQRSADPLAPPYALSPGGRSGGGGGGGDASVSQMHLTQSQLVSPMKSPMKSVRTE